MSMPSFSSRGVVDLSALRSSPGTPSPSSEAPAGDGGSFVFDATEQNFQTRVLDLSRTVPVVLDLWADWCGPCKQLSPVLERLAAEASGAWVLAKVDVDAEQRLASAFQVQGIPAVFAVIAGQLVPLFTGALPESTVRQYLEQLLALAAQHGVTGTAGGVNESADLAPALPADIQEALEAMDRGDLDEAAAAYRRALAARPGDERASVGLAQVELVRRVDGVDPAAVLAAADDGDLDAQLLAADVETMTGRVESAFGRLLDLVGRTSGEERDRVRQHLVGLFTAVGTDDPRVVRARQQLTSVLF